MKYFLNIFIFFSLFIVTTNAQGDTSFILERKLKGDISMFAVDRLDNIYILSSTDQLKKLDVKGDSIAVFNNVRKAGKVSGIDVSNPLRVLLYYKDFSTVVMLDRLLNVRNTIDLRKQNIFQVQAISLSYDNKIWLYDEFENKLKKIDEDGSLLFETTDFRQLFNESYSFSSIYDQDGLLYLFDKQKGVLVFDYYGTLKNKILLYGWNNFKVADKYIFGTKNDSLFRYRPSTFNEQRVLLPQTIRQSSIINFTASKVYALKKDELEIYLLK